MAITMARGPLGDHEVRDWFYRESEEAAVEDVALDFEGWIGLHSWEQRQMKNQHQKR